MHKTNTSKTLHLTTMFVGIFSIVLVCHTLADKDGIEAVFHVVPFAGFLTVVKATFASLNHKLGRRFANVRLYLGMYITAGTVLIMEGKPLLLACILPAGTAMLKTGWCIVNGKMWGVKHGH